MLCWVIWKLPALKARKGSAAGPGCRTIRLASGLCDLKDHYSEVSVVEKDNVWSLWQVLTADTLEQSHTVYSRESKTI